ncbi:hypothetical protein RKD55_004655 [Rossellomorea marisflavi]
MMSLPQQQLAAHYAVVHLEREIKGIKALIPKTSDTQQDFLKVRLKELEENLKVFDEINNQLN